MNSPKITIFNRKTLTVTFSMEEQSRIPKPLADNGIGYRIKAINRMSTSPFAAGTRGRTGTFEQDLNAMYEYEIYVKKPDYALHLSNCTVLGVFSYKKDPAEKSAG